jgi:APA family basic amino acid/polyamine antiporter
LVAATVLIALTCLTLLGIKESLRVNTVLSIVAIGGLAAVIGGAVPHFGQAALAPTTGGLGGVAAAAGLVFFAYIGFDNVSNLAEEVKEPTVTIPRGLMLALGLSSILYVLVAIAALSLVPWWELAASGAPLALAASRLFGQVAFDVLAVIGMLTTLNTVLVLLLVSSRIVYGMAAERAVPAVIGRVIPRTGAPYAASLATLAVALAFLGLGSLSAVAKVTSFGALATFALVNLAQLHLRRVAPHVHRPFKAPGQVGWLSLSGLFGLLSCVFLLTQFDGLTALFFLVMPASGAAVYLLFTRKSMQAPGADFHEPHEAER